MKINWLSYYMDYDGYGRFSSRMVRALQRQGVRVKPATMDHVTMPEWMQKQEGIDWDALTISFMPPYFLQDVPGRHWLYSMTEGSRIPPEWVEKINGCNIERVLVPCQHNVDAFRDSGVIPPVDVVPGGVDPDEFPYFYREAYKPFTFITFADRGFRKGWTEVWDAFYLAFGGKTTGLQDVRLILKCRPKDTPTTLDWMRKAEDGDKRITYQIDDTLDIRATLLQADCLALPSRSEGWGMIHREAASLGIPVIAQPFSGLDDGSFEEWGLPVNGKVAPIPKEAAVALGEWQVADVDELAEGMRMVYDYPQWAIYVGKRASLWLHKNQTWDHAARRLMEIVNGEPALERTALSVLG